MNTESESAVNVLLVDDKPENLIAIESILGDLGQNLVRATSAREALRFMLVEDVALILLDVQMPGVNGFELAELIRGRPRTQHTPIIFISAESSEKNFIFKGYSLGAVDYLTKPVEPEILRSKVRFFIRMFQQTREIKRQAKLLELSNIDLDSVNVALEERVRERTSQLEAANRELENEITVRKNSEARLATEHAITRVLADASSFDDASPLILRTFIDHLDAEICVLWLLDDENKELHCSQLETANGRKADLAEFISETRSVALKPGLGLPGAVWEQGAPVAVPAAIQGERFPRARYAAGAGLTSAVGFPIKIGPRFYGVIEFYLRHAVLPTDQPLLDMFEAAGSEIGQFIKRKRLEAERADLLTREKALREQAETASRLKDQFLATVSHELRTPLNAILGWGQMLNTGRLGAEEQATALQTIYRNARAQAQLIDDLLDASRLISGNLHLNLSPTDVIPLVEAAIDVVRPSAASKNITIEASFPDTHETITCDSPRVQQIVWNLLTNAVKFTPKGGHIDVRVATDGPWLVVEVSDTGTGIEADFLPFVFERFRQADATSTRSHDGLGLGLSIVKHLVELHGGSVEAESEGLGRGATFRLRLPGAAAGVPLRESETEGANGDKPDVMAEGIRLDGVRVLVVDDDRDTCDMLKFALGLTGAHVESSSSVDEAFGTVREWRPDILVTDLNMPGADGYELLERVRSMSDGMASIPAIALTAMARPEDGERVIAAGFQLHLPKPVDVELLGGEIANLVTNRS